MASQKRGDKPSLHALQASRLVKEYFPNGLSGELLSEELLDPALLYVDLDELCAMGEDALRDLLCPPPGAEPAEPAGAEETEQDPWEREDWTPQSTADCVVVTVDGEGLQAKVALLSPPEGIPAPTTRDMLRALFQHKITRGLRNEFITRLAERPIYDRTFRIAEAQLPVDGQAGQVTYYFNPDADLSPHVDEDGEADYRDLEFIKSVKAGDLLCQITPAIPGVDGVNVYGKPIPAKAAGAPPVRCGANTVSFLDGREIRASCDGQVFLRGDTVEVSQILILDAVDFSTGNIDFHGSVHVRENVANGFSVRADGDIVVKGVVENASLTAGGSIALCRGMKGAGGGVLKAGQDIRTLFLESCSAQAGGSIYADTILNSQVESGLAVCAFGKRGCLLGGACTAGDAVSAVQIGNDAHIPTAVKIDTKRRPPETDPALSAALSRYREMEEQLSALAHADADAPGAEAAFPRELARIAVLCHRLEQRSLRLQKESGRPVQPRRREIRVSDALHPGVTVEIDGVSAKNTVLRDRCHVYERWQQLLFYED